MHAFGLRGVDEDLELRARRGQPIELGGLELEGEALLGLARLLVALEPVGAQHRPDHIEEAAKDAVLVEAVHGVDRGADLADQRFGLRGVRVLGIEARAEQPDQEARDVGVRHQRLLHVCVAEGGAGLAEVSRHRSQHRNLTPREVGAQDEAVVTVVLEVAVPDADEGVLEGLAHVVAVELPALG